MNPGQPPKHAAWLLRHFGSSPNNAAIIGGGFFTSDAQADSAERQTATA